jgi:hypothetical protein
MDRLGDIFALFIQNYLGVATRDFEQRKENKGTAWTGCEGLQKKPPVSELGACK